MSSVADHTLFVVNLPKVFWLVVVVFLACLVAGSWGLLFLAFILFPLIAFLDPKFFIKLGLMLMSFVHLFAEPNYTVNIPPQSLTMIQVIPAGAAFGQNYDEVILVGALVVILSNMVQIKKINVPGLIGWVLASILVMSASALINQISPSILLNYFTSYQRFPVFVLAFLVVPHWTIEELSDLRNLAFLICLPIQVVAGLFQNLGNLASGSVVLIDGLTGTFNYPFGDWSTMFVTIGMIYALCRLMTRYQAAYGLWFLFGLLYLLSAQQNLSTLMAFGIFCVVIVYFLFLRRRTMSDRFRLVLRIGAVFLVMIAGFAIIGELISTTDNVDVVTTLTGYFSAKLVQQQTILGISPKILTYLNLSDLFSTGAINPLWGAGPAMFLSGLALYNFGGPLTAQYSSAAQIESIFGGTGRGDLMENNIVAFGGELGMIGLLAMYMPFVSIIRHLRKRRTIDRKLGSELMTEWVTFSLIFFIVYSSLLLMFEVQPLVFLLALMCGIAIRSLDLEART